MKQIMILASLLALAGACRETRAISSTEVGSINQSANFSVSDAEAERMMEIIRSKIERGEDLSPNLTRIIQIVMDRQGPDYAWKSLQVDADRQQRLQTKFQTYSKLYESALDPAGFVEGCDGLLFTSLLVASGLNQDIAVAESRAQPGRWYRSAAHDCYPTGQSRSSISRDMLLGLSLALWQTSDGSAVNRLLLYSEKNKGVLGDAIDGVELAGAATMSPSLLSLYSEIDYRLNGRNSTNRGYFPELGKNFVGFEAHLMSLRLILKSRLYGGLIEGDFNLIASQVSTQPKNALFQAIYHGFTDGDGNLAADILLDEKYFPSNALPGSAQRCELYLWQRDQDTKDWQPCTSENQTFPAVDFFWVHALLNNSLR
ncbi:MAG TPA: hypothetical protein VE954_29975 [Oligoflexus sp.]|uniref:hypothetical protein n=1 Tax=Oligoflexus sp. TaxID=1971216 RepID=UPI002D51A943|nr:hypothetical protein [Oligoflexus sp.]HYX37352.1 hypothetical protein [Oligoflexus sp.]